MWDRSDGGVYALDGEAVGKYGGLGTWMERELHIDDFVLELYSYFFFALCQCLK